MPAEHATRVRLRRNAVFLCFDNDLSYSLVPNRKNADRPMGK